LPQSHAFNT